MNKDIENLLAQLQQDKSLKVWSLIITFFGDVVITRGGDVSVKTVQQLLGAMGVGSGAVRTALSRLAGDGWVERQKLGRESFYKLTKEAGELSHRAAGRIYAPVPCATNKSACQSGQWRIAIARSAAGFSDTPDNPMPENTIEVAANCRLYLSTNDCGTAFNDSLIVTGELHQIPQWVTQDLIPASVRCGYQSIIQRFSTIRRQDKLSPLNCLVLRCLLVHEWRRLLLRTPVVPLELQSPDWPEHDCRRLVSVLYQQLSSRSELWLDEHATCINGPLPPPTEIFTHRFSAKYYSA